MLQGVHYVHPEHANFVHKSPDISILPSASLALSGWCYADFHGAVNFAITEFSEVRSRLRLVAPCLWWKWIIHYFS